MNCKRELNFSGWVMIAAACTWNWCPEGPSTGVGIVAQESTQTEWTPTYLFWASGILSGILVKFVLKVSGILKLSGILSGILDSIWVESWVESWTEWTPEWNPGHIWVESWVESWTEWNPEWIRVESINSNNRRLGFEYSKLTMKLNNFIVLED